MSTLRKTAPSTPRESRGRGPERGANAAGVCGDRFPYAVLMVEALASVNGFHERGAERDVGTGDGEPRARTAPGARRRAVRDEARDRRPGRHARARPGGGPDRRARAA